MRTHIDLFSGIGGFSLACRWAGVETVAFAEIDPYASKVLEKNFPGVRNYGDVRDVPAMDAWLLTAGVPCQPASVAGKRLGAEDARWLWPQTLAVVENGNYEWLLFENPCGILSLNDGVEFERICTQLESYGYEVQPLIIPAAGVGAFHRRGRVWIIAHSEQKRRGFHRLCQDRESLHHGNGHDSRKTEGWTIKQLGDVSPISADDWPQRIQRGWEKAIQWIGLFQRGEDGERLEEERIRLDVPEPLIRGTSNGIPNWVDRVACLGNAVVPSVPYQLIKRMIEAEA